MLYELEDGMGEAGYALSGSGSSRVAWAEGGRHFVLEGEGMRSSAQLLAVAVNLRRQLTAPERADTEILAAPPASEPLLRSIQEEVLPAAGVSKM